MKGSRFIDISGQRFGMIVAIHIAGKQFGRFKWQCVCDCGKALVIDGSALRASTRAGRVRSCGCFGRRKAADRLRTHGLRNAPEYAVWARMRNRCLNPHDSRYRDYGGRGITICERWNRFENFFADMGTRRKGLSIERINNNGNYEPSNCRWATALEQQRNRRSTVFLTLDGITKTQAEWARDRGVGHKIISTRLRLGWSVRDAILKPVRPLVRQAA